MDGNGIGHPAPTSSLHACWLDRRVGCGGPVGLEHCCVVHVSVSDGSKETNSKLEKLERERRRTGHALYVDPPRDREAVVHIISA